LDQDSLTNRKVKIVSGNLGARLHAITPGIDELQKIICKLTDKTESEFNVQKMQAEE
jgi:hypothetical protein